jgi:hypothetical protein
VPDESQWIIQRCAADPTSGSLREVDACANEFGGARLSCPMKLYGRMAIGPYVLPTKATPSQRLAKPDKIG